MGKKKNRKRRHLPEINYADRNKRLKQLGFSTYAEYLGSPLWKDIHSRVLKRDGKRCRLCNRRGRQVHHNSYSMATLLGEDLSGLATLCRSCHVRVEFDGTRKRSAREVLEEFHHLRREIRALRAGRTSFWEVDDELTAEFRAIVRG